MGHLHTCPLHLKLMPTTSLPHILHSQETRDNKFDYIFCSQLKQIAPKPFRLFDLKFSPVGCDVMSAYASLLTIPFLFIIAENTNQHFTLSIISTNFSLFPQDAARIVSKKVNNNKTLLFSCPIITIDLLSQLIFYRAARKTSCSLSRHGLSYLFRPFL